MALATYKDLCFDATDAKRTGEFWASALGLLFEPADDGVVLRGATPAHSVWIDPVPEPKTVKHRVRQSNIGGVVGIDEEEDFSWVERIPNAPFDGLVFCTVPEPKTTKNRVHIDLVAPTIDPIVAAGASVLRSPDHDISWHVLADPEGNEFCVFDRF